MNKRAQRPGKRSGVRRQHRPEPGLGGIIEPLLRGHPTGLLGFASTAASGTPDDDGPLRLDLLIDVLESDRSRASTALLLTLALFMDDEAEAQRLRGLADGRNRPLPLWLRRLDDVHLTEAFLLTEPYGETEDVLLGAQFADGTLMTLIVGVRPTFGLTPSLTLMAEGSPAEVLGTDLEEGIELTPVPMADAAARIREIVATADATFPPPAIEDWPDLRPLVKWMTSLAPPDGVGYPSMTQVIRVMGAEVDAFLTSPAAAGLDDIDGSDVVVERLAAFCASSDRSFLRWTPLKAMMLFDDWWPRHTDGSGSADDALSEVLSMVVVWSGEVTGRPEAMTNEILTVVRESRRHETFEPIRLWEPPSDLEVTPLPIEEWDPRDIPGRIADQVAEVVRLTDEAALALADKEFRTASRRLVKLAATAEPRLFERGSLVTAAAAITWAVAGNNWMLGRDVTAKDIWEHYGLASGATQRAETLLRKTHPDRRVPLRYEPDLELATSVGRARFLDRRALLDKFPEYREPLD